MMRQDTATDQFRRSVFMAALWRSLVIGTAAFLFAWGTVALCVRVAMDGPTGWLWWISLGVAAVWGFSVWLARRQMPTRDTALAVLDRHARLGGLLMASRHPGAENWAAAMDPRQGPTVRWRGRSAGLALAGAGVFVLSAMLMPLPAVEATALPMDVSRSMDTLSQQLDVLEEQKILEPPDADQVRQEVERIAEQARGNDPARTWEALDQLAEQLERAADESSELAQQRRDEASAAAALAEALAQHGDQLTPQRMSEAMSALSQLSEAATGQPTTGGAELPAELAAALGEAGVTPMSPEMLKQLSDFMEGRGGDLSAMLEALEKANLTTLSDFDPTPSSGGDAAEIDPSELMDFLQGEGKCEGGDVLLVCQGLKAGRGGINRGPGHAEMVWKDPSSKEGADFQPQVLPPARLKELSDARMLGISQGAPQTLQNAAGSTGGALSDTPVGGGSAEGLTVQPRHRGAVQRYFERSPPPEASQ